MDLDKYATGDDGMIADERKLDWSFAPNSERKDRVLDIETVKRLTKKSNFKGFRHYLGVVLLAVLNGYCIHLARLAEFWACQALVIPLVIWQGFILCSIGFAGMHECEHFTAFDGIRINKIMGAVSAFPRFSLFEQELLLHKEHHTFIGDPKRDAELVGGSKGFEEGFRKVPDSKFDYFYNYALLLYKIPKEKFGSLVNCAAGHPVDYSGWQWNIPRSIHTGAPTIQQRLQRAALMQIWAYLVVIPLWIKFFGAASLFWYWLIPVWVGELPLWYLRQAEHADCTIDHNGLTNTRTVSRLNFIVRFVYFNCNFHAEHHLYPMIPFHALPEAHELLKTKLKKVSDNYHQVNYEILFTYIPLQIAKKPITA